MNKKPSIDDFSPHLFWDVERKELDIDKNRKFIVRRVLEFGLLHDWVLIKTLYGLEGIASLAITIKDLDRKSCSFISLLSKIPEDQFLCYTTRQSTPRHWNF